MTHKVTADVTNKMLPMRATHSKFSF